MNMQFGEKKRRVDVVGGSNRGMKVELRIHTRVGVTAAVLLKMQIFWDVTLRRLINSYRRFEGS
jgi:hypothetical protein